MVAGFAHCRELLSKLVDFEIGDVQFDCGRMVARSCLPPFGRMGEYANKDSERGCTTASIPGSGMPAYHSATSPKPPSTLLSFNQHAHAHDHQESRIHPMNRFGMHRQQDPGAKPCADEEPDLRSAPHTAH